MAWFARRQGGAISVEQLRLCELDASAVSRRERGDRLFRVHRGVYAVGHPALEERGRWFAGLLAGGDACSLSHVDGLAIWGLKLPPEAPRVTHITAPTHRRSTPILICHQGAPRTTTRNGLRVTTAAQVLLDIAQTESARFTEIAVNDAFMKQRVKADALLELACNSQGRRGTGVLRAIARWQHDHDHVTRSQLEWEFLLFLTESGFPEPLVNVPLRGFEADFFFPAHGLVVETDGLACHTTPFAFSRDRKRDRVHRGAGLRVERITWHDVMRERAALRREMRTWLRR